MHHETEEAGISSLPPGVLHLIFSFLSPRDLAACTSVSRNWHKLNRDKASNSLWKGFYVERWRVTGAAGDNVCWQTKYGSKMKQGKSWAGKYEHDSLYGHKAGIKSLKLLPSHGMLLTGSQDRTVRLWDLNYGMPLSISRPHGGTVRSVALDHNLVASGSSDNVVRLWHAHNSASGSSGLDSAESTAALLPSAAAAAELDLPGLDAAGLVAAGNFLDMDAPADRISSIGGGSSSDGRSTHVVTAAALAAIGASSAGAAAAVASGQQRHGPYSIVTGDADEGLFDLLLPGQQLRGHIGPVTSLCLSDSCLYSGSWDYTVRCWRRGSWDCISVLKYQDWVWSVVARAGLLLVASGPEVHVHDLPTGKLVRKFQNLHEGSVSCLEGTHSGRTLFTGGADGLLMAHDLRMREPSRVLWHHNAGINGLALEDPWLVSAASDGTVIMHNVELALPTNCSSASGTSRSSSGSSRAGGGSSGNSVPARRSLSSPGHPGPMYCVDIAESWLAAGGEAAIVSTWDFTKAAEAAARAAAARAARNSSKRAAKQRRAAAAAAAGAAAAESGGGGAGKGGKRSGGLGESSSRRGRPSSSSHAGMAAATAAPAVEAGGSTPGASNSGVGTDHRGSKGLLSSVAAAAAAAAAATTPAGDATVAAAAAATTSSQPAGTADRFGRTRRSQAAPRQQQQQPSAESAGAGSAAAASAACGSSRQPSQHPNRNHHHHHPVYPHCSPNSPQLSSGGFQYRHNSPQHTGFYYGSPQQQQWHGYGSSPQQHHQQQWHSYGSSPQQHHQQQWHFYSSSPPNGGRMPAANARNSFQQQQQQRVQSGNSSHRAGGSRQGIPIPASSTAGSAGSTSSSRHVPHHYRRLALASSREGRTSSSAAARAASGEECADAGGGGSNSSSSDGGAGDRHSASPPTAAPYHVSFSSSYPSAAQPGPWVVPGSSPRFEAGCARHTDAIGAAARGVHSAAASATTGAAPAAGAAAGASAGAGAAHGNRAARAGPAAPVNNYGEFPAPEAGSISN